jgi:hypothetical protein
MMTQKEAFALVNGFLTSPRCQFQGLNEAARISEAMMVLNPEKVEMPASKQGTESGLPPRFPSDLNGRRTNEDAKAKPANHRSAP